MSQHFVDFETNVQITNERAHIRDHYSAISRIAAIAGSGRTPIGQRLDAERQIAGRMREIAKHREIIAGLEINPRQTSIRI